MTATLGVLATATPAETKKHAAQQTLQALGISPALVSLHKP